MAEVPASAPVRLELRQGASRPVLYDLTEAGFLVGSVPGCDLRLPGANLPPVMCLVVARPDGVWLRKLAPTQPLLVNGQPASAVRLADGDRVTLGAADLVVRIPANYATRAVLEKPILPTVTFTPVTAASPDELTALRRQLHQRYRKRRARLAARQELLDRTALQIQDQKRTLEARARELAEGETQAAALTRDRTQFDEERRRFLEALNEQERRREDLTARELRLEEARRILTQGQAQHQADLVRLDRLAATQDQRQQELDDRGRAVEQRSAVLRNELQDVEDQARELSELQVRLSEESERVAQQTAEFAARETELSQRAAVLEGQQAMLATLRTRVERMREEMRREGTLLAEQRARQEAVEAELHQRDQQSRQLRVELDNERQVRDQERQRFEERSTILELAVGRTRQLQENLERHEIDLEQRRSAFDAQAAAGAEQRALLEARTEQLVAWQQRVEADRQALRDREAALTRAEQAREALQEQLRRRSEELAARQRTIDEQSQQQETIAAEVQRRTAELAALRAALEEERQTAEVQRTERAAEFDRRAVELELAEQRQALAWQKIQETGRAAAAERKALQDERDRWQAEQDAGRAIVARERDELADARLSLSQLRDALPDLERQAHDAVEYLSQGRERLRDYLSELHTFARQGRDELEALRSQVRSEGEEVRRQEQALHRIRDEHRLGVAAFRQQIIEWQGQLAEMRRVLSQGETHLERRQAEVDAKAREVEATTIRLARQSEELDEQQRQVAERRHEMERHLADMREWYRRKLRELAGNTEPAPSVVADAPPAPTDEPAASRDILSLTGEVDPGDRQLGELLRTLELVDADTLTALLVEARRQRRSLRQVLLSSNYLTLYQLALIEAGNVDALVLGPTRVVDRLRSTSRETVYRVFDPRAGHEALLRHLGEADALDAVRPDEFRQRFAAAASVRHPHLAATLEVLELAGRPAVLQEWLVGLPSSDWPALAAVPGVWFRLLGQAALALHTIHQAGLVHGHLTAGRIVLTADGVVKVCGLGEPPWLLEPTTDEPHGDDAAFDLTALGRIAADWTLIRGKGKGKPLPDALQAVVHRLTAADSAERFPDAAALLEALDRAGADVPANAEAWERLLRHVREHAAAEVVERQSA